MYCTCRAIRPLHQLDVLGMLERLELHHLRDCSAAANRPVGVEHVGDAAAHAGGEIAPGRPEHDDAPAGHVLAAVVADAFDDRERAAVADGEALARHAAEVRLAARRAVERDVADDDVLFGDERRLPRRIDDDLAARQALADVVVRVAFERQRDAARHERAEALAGRSGERAAGSCRRAALRRRSASSPRSRASCRPCD